MARRAAPASEPDADFDAFAARVREISALVLIGIGLYMLLALVSFRLPDPGAETIPRGVFNLGGSFGHTVASGLLLVFGKASWLLFLFLVGYGLSVFMGVRIERLVLKVLGVVVFTSMVSILLAGADGLAGASAQSPHGAGGRLGAVLSPRLAHAFGGPGRLMIVVFGALVALVLATEWLLSSLLRRGAGRVGTLVERARAMRPALAGVSEVDEEAPRPRRRRGRAATADADSDGDADSDSDEAGQGRVRGRRKNTAVATEPSDDVDAEEVTPVARGRRRVRLDESSDVAEGSQTETDEAEVDAEEESPPADADADADADTAAAAKSAPRRVAPRVLTRPKPPAPKKRALGVQPTLPFDTVYPFPPIDLFREREVDDDDANSQAIERNCEAIERKLGSFGIGTKVVHASSGPAVTQYELRLDEGIKVSRVASFEPDLAAALKAVSVRVVAPIPGKDTVGIEVPNEHRQMVFMRELIEIDRERPGMAIPLFLGKDVGGESLVEDLARMPHLLIAGTTGSGKSVCINAILLSILMTRSPKQVRMVLIDPKMVELQAYKNVPHLACDVVTNMKKAPGVLQWAVDEMERRYAMLSAAGVNHIASFNKLGQSELENRLQRPVKPDEVQLAYMVLVIDELADLMAVAQVEVEESIQRLAQKSRAVGLHVILATQRPSTDVITGVIKANLPCQIAFKVNRKIDSRVILDSNGAEKLLGHGDMLYVPPGANKLVRAQGAFVADSEIHKVVSFLEEKGQKPAFIPDLVQTKTGSQRGPKDKDDLYEKAVEVILGQQRGSATLLQRALAVGYTRATRLLELMEEDGLVGAFNGSKSRDVLMTLDEWKAREEAIAEELAAHDGADDAGAAGDEEAMAPAEDDGLDGDEWDEGPGDDETDGSEDED
ncbi:MAG: DNA translocase FtsK [Planctomycetota bacterium]